MIRADKAWIISCLLNCLNICIRHRSRKFCCYFALGGVQSIVMVYLSICLPHAYLENHMATLKQIFMHNASGSVIFCYVMLWYVMYFQFYLWNYIVTRWVLCFAVCDTAWPNSDIITARTTALIPTKFCSSLKIGKYTLWVAHWGIVCCLWLPCIVIVTVSNVVSVIFWLTLLEVSVSFPGVFVVVPCSCAFPCDVEQFVVSCKC